MVIWLIGLSGSGKSFYAETLSKKIKNSIVVDGDDVRKFITPDLGYSLTDRKKNSKIISDLCNFLEKKGFIVICPILSIFKEHLISCCRNELRFFLISLQYLQRILIFNLYIKNQERNHQISGE